MMAQCTAHAQIKSVYGVSRVTCHREPGPPISMSKVTGPGVEAKLSLGGKGRLHLRKPYSQVCGPEGWDLHIHYWLTWVGQLVGQQVVAGLLVDWLVGP